MNVLTLICGSVQKLRDLQSYARIQPVVNQVQLPPPPVALPLPQLKGIRITAASDPGKTLQCKCALQVEVHCWHRNDRLVEFCRGSGVQITAYSPTGGNPDYSGPRPWDDPTVVELASKYNKTVHQVREVES